jgi:carbonic anhydrase
MHIISMDPTLEFERQKARKKDRHEGHTHFSMEAPSQSVAQLLREKHIESLLDGKAPRLTQAQSISLLLAGNLEHVQALKEPGASLPKERYDKIKAGEADYLVVACSDSRLLRLDSEKDGLVGLFIRIAGNVIPKRGTPSFVEMQEAVRNVKKDGAIIIEGHDGGPGCGAVNERVKWIKKGMPHTGSVPLDNLLHCVLGENPEANATAQLAIARDTLGIHGRASAALVYDWEHKKHGHEEPIHVVSSNHSDVIEILKDNWNHRHEASAEKSDLIKLLESQRPHALAVGTSDLPYSVGTIFHADQNEIFSTTGSENGLDELDVASILYAVQHLGVKTIPFVAPGMQKDESEMMRMFDSWEEELRGQTVNGENLLAKMLDSGELTITRFRYDLKTGAVEGMATN